MRRHRLWLMVVGGAAIAGGLACSGDAVRTVGDAMVEAGTVLVDAGDELTPDANAAFDAAHPHDAADAVDATPAPEDAGQPPRAFLAECDRSYTRVVTHPDYVITTTQWQAEVADAAFSTAGVPRFWVVHCEADLERFGVPASTCPSGATCSGDAPPSPACTVNGGGGFDEGRALIHCGTRSEVNYTNPAIDDTVSGQRWRRVRVEIE